MTSEWILSFGQETKYRQGKGFESLPESWNVAWFVDREESVLDIRILEEFEKSRSYHRMPFLCSPLGVRHFMHLVEATMRASHFHPFQMMDHPQVSRSTIIRRRLEIVNLDFAIIIGREKNEWFGVSDDMFLKV